VNGLEVLVLVECCEIAEYTLRNLNTHVAVCALRRLRTALLVIEKYDHVDLRVVTLFKRDLRACNKGIHCADRAGHVIESW